LARHALERGGTSGAVLNAADEIAVDAFLNGTIGFLDIVPLVERVLERIPREPVDSLESVIEADSLARETARSFLRA
jgi:1-deoxy-D-xylulose-5-phosphate reductoisomerase